MKIIAETEHPNNHLDVLFSVYQNSTNIGKNVAQALNLDFLIVSPSSSIQKPVNNLNIYFSLIDAVSLYSTHKASSVLNLDFLAESPNTSIYKFVETLNFLFSSENAINEVVKFIQTILDVVFTLESASVLGGGSIINANVLNMMLELIEANKIVSLDPQIIDVIMLIQESSRNTGIEPQVINLTFDIIDDLIKIINVGAVNLNHNFDINDPDKNIQKIIQILNILMEMNEIGTTQQLMLRKMWGKNRQITRQLQD